MVLKFKSRHYNFGWWFPFFRFMLLFDNGHFKREEPYKYYGEHSANLLLQISSNIITWIFSCNDYEDYNYKDDIFIYQWTLCVLGFYLNIVEHYYDES